MYTPLGTEYEPIITLIIGIKIELKAFVIPFSSLLLKGGFGLVRLRNN